MAMNIRDKQKNFMIIGDATRNVGDHLLRLQVLDYLLDVISNPNIVPVEWNRPKISAFFRENCEIPNLSLKEDFLKVLIKSIGRVIIIGPGQMIRSNSSLFNLIFMLMVSVLCRISLGRVYIVAVGIGVFPGGAKGAAMENNILVFLQNIYQRQGVIEDCKEKIPVE